MLTGKEIKHLLFAQSFGAIEPLKIEKITSDTRQIVPGACFVCIEGYTVDGHDLIAEAEQKGAILIVAQKTVTTDLPYLLVGSTKKALAILSDAFYEQPSQKLKMIGVTGTNGKTTVTHMIDHILRSHGKKTGLTGTMYNRILDQTFNTVNTTPDIVTNQSLLAKMFEQQVEACTMEVSSHGLVQGRVWGIDYDVAVFTNLSQDHLGFHHTMQEYFYAKSLLFAQLGNKYQLKNPKAAVINCDDSYGEQLIDLTSAPVLTYSCKNKGTINAKDIHIDSQGTVFRLEIFGEERLVRLKLVGMFNVYNALAAIGAAYVLGLPLEKTLSALEKMEGVRGRFQLIPNSSGVSVIVDYAHTPDGLLNVLETIQEFKKRKVYCVVGCGGDRDSSKRMIMAEIAVQNADVAVFTSDNPRTEDPEIILDQMTQNLSAEQYVRIRDRKKAIDYALLHAEKDDVVLIAGKGHEDYQIIGKEKIHFDDVEVVNAFYKN